MNNKEIALSFKALADLMELHEENAFKVRAYRNAYNALRKFERPLSEMTLEEIEAIPGVGKSSATKVSELLERGTLDQLEKFYAGTPEGVREMLGIRGLGPAKVRAVWKGLGVESPGELLYACNENRLIELSGFGLKTQEDIRSKIEFFLDAREKWLYAGIEDNVGKLLHHLKKAYRDANLSVVGQLSRRCPVVDRIELLIGEDLSRADIEALSGIVCESDGAPYHCRTAEGIPFTLHTCAPGKYAWHKFRLTGSADFVERFGVVEDAESEMAVFNHSGIAYVIPEMRESADVLDGKIPDPEKIVDVASIRGILHNHSTYSDGLHTLSEIAVYVRDQGFAYFGISDHSQSAVYAGGLKPPDVEAQFDEIDRLNATLKPFRIFKGIESDILSDGSLDYDADLLARFDFVVASIHSGMKMDEQRATDRLIRAIEHPATTILGHLTGRLLLAREGYPVNHRKIIEACAANGVAIELNANPLRLDIDYRWIPEAMEKGVMIAINPDAHSMEGIHNIRYGVMAARKGGLLVDACLNALPLEAFSSWIAQRK